MTMFKKLPRCILATNLWKNVSKVFNEMFKFFIENELISPNQLRFQPGDSCMNQLLAILMKCTNHLMNALNLEVFF